MKLINTTKKAAMAATLGAGLLFAAPATMALAQESGQSVTISTDINSIAKNLVDQGYVAKDAADDQLKDIFGVEFENGQVKSDGTINISTDRKRLSQQDIEKYTKAMVAQGMFEQKSQDEVNKALAGIYGDDEYTAQALQVTDVDPNAGDYEEVTTPEQPSNVSADNGTDTAPEGAGDTGEATAPVADAGDYEEIAPEVSDTVEYSNQSESGAVESSDESTDTGYSADNTSTSATGGSNAQATGSLANTGASVLGLVAAAGAAGAAGVGVARKKS